MGRWKRLLVEIYRPGVYEGRWEMTADEGFDRDYGRDCVQKISTDDRYRGARLLFLEEEETLIIGVFCDCEPPAAPRRGTVLPPEMFETPE